MNILCFEDKFIPDFLDMHLKMFILNGQRNISKCQYPCTSNVVVQERYGKILWIAADIQFCSCNKKSHKKTRKRHCMKF